MDSTIRSEHSPLQNALLAALPAADWAHVGNQFEQVFLPFGRVLFEPDEEVRHMYFPVDALVALVCPLANGAADEISLVGREGVVGVASFMGGGSTPRRAVVACAGHAYRLSRQVVHDEFLVHGEFMRVLLAYVLSLVNQVAQTAMCNRCHSVEQRLCRWLLLCVDRMPGRQFELTHGLLAQMLGVRRESVSAAAAGLRACGAIDYSRGQLTVLDRARLEARVCECYLVAKKTADGLLHPRPRQLQPMRERLEFLADTRD